MKIPIFLLFILLIPASLLAVDNVNYKLSIGTIISPTIASKIELEKDNTNLTLEEYEGKSGGIEFSFAIILDQMELSYIMQKYEAEKATAYEIGKIAFDVETLEAMYYFADPMKDSGINLGIGAGKGVVKLTVDKEVNGTKIIEEGVVFAKEYHLGLGLLYNFNKNNVISLKYYSQTIYTVTGDPFTNSLGELLYSFQF